MQFLQKIWNWLVVSSADPTKVSLTVKGFLSTAGTIVLLVSPLVHLKLTQTDIDQGIDVAIQIILQGFAVISALVTLFGMIRKINLTWPK